MKEFLLREEIMVTFPSLGLKFNIDRVAFNILGIDIYWYAILIVSAILISFLILKINNKRCNIEYKDILDLSIFLIPISIICARLYYVIFDLEYFLKNPSQIFNIRDGGLAIYGGIIGGIITCYIFCKKRNISFLDLLDYLVPCLALGQAIGRWGNFINIEAHGDQTDNLFRMGIIENGQYIEVHPTFLYESICTFVIFIILMVMTKKRKFAGELTFIYLILYSFVRFFIEGLRTDSLMLFSLRISQVLSLVIFVLSCIMLIINIIKIRNMSKNIEKNNTKLLQKK